ncbi:MAG: isopentenyl phosphate kinase [Candidatus Aenigmarchaeota archaeon]|nr:isopentenyl phosphate kinase [Candidatus Aenigmarchaeota archaeon]
MGELILLKLGGSVVTDKSKPFTEDIKIIRRLAREIHAARKEKNFRLVVGHGGGSYPHVPAKKYKTNEGVVNKKSCEGIAKVQDAASTLNRIIVRELIAAGECAVSIHLSSSCVTENGEIKYMFLKPIKKLLDLNMIPVPYGDVCLDSEKGCSILSTEKILSYLAKKLPTMEKKYKVSRILICTKVPGVFTGDPIKNPNAKHIPLVTPKNLKEIINYVKGSAGIDVTGGMLHKVEMLLELAKKEIESEIINATKPGILKRALLGERGLGTIIRSD